MHIYEVMHENIDETHVVIAHNEEEARQLIFDYLRDHSLVPNVQYHDLLINGPLDPNDYAESIIIN